MKPKARRKKDKKEKELSMNEAGIRRKQEGSRQETEAVKKGAGW
jgi:hypothetical protein